jgi:nucleoside-triphosphatase THEP1
VAFEALPQMISAFGDQRRFFRSPVRALARTIAAGVEWLSTVQKSVDPTPIVFLLTGEKATGKTEFVGELVRTLKSHSISVGGILAPGVWMDDERLGFDILDIRTSAKVPLCRKGVPATGITAGPFVFDQAGVAFGNQAIEMALEDEVQVLCIDEIGPLEISGGGWSESLRRVQTDHRGQMVLVVRSSLLSSARESFGIDPSAIWNINEIGPQQAADIIRSALSSQKA